MEKRDAEGNIVPFKVTCSTFLLRAQVHSHSTPNVRPQDKFPSGMKALADYVHSKAGPA